MRLLCLPAAVLALGLGAVCTAQAIKKPGPFEIPGLTVPKEPSHLIPAAVDFYDSKYHIGFHVPAGWNFERKDGVLSTFSADVPSAKRDWQIRGVAAINYNPYPPTTFSGALFYYSVNPHTTAQVCTAQASAGKVKYVGEEPIAGVTFQHGRELDGASCVESRDEVFTAMQGDACLRFDLVVHTFCHDASGMQALSDSQRADIETRLAKMLGSLHTAKH